MVALWEPGTQYNYNDVVEYHGVAYKIIQPHRSQGDWTPDIVPALWGRMQDQSCVQGHGGQHGHGGQQGQYQQGQYQQQPQQHQPQQPQYNYGGGGAAPGGSNEKPEEKHWYDVDDDTKKKLEIGGGLLAGAAVIGGGFAAWQHHKNKEEKAQGQAWASSNWLSEAQARTAAFHQRGPQGPYTWVLVQGKNIPQGAIEGGREQNGNVLYIARTFHEGGIHIGKAGRHLGKGAVYGYGGKEIETDQYEVLLGDPSRVKWVPVSNSQFSAQSAVEGGRERDGTPLYVAQAFYKGGTHPGKYNKGFGGACIVYGDTEKIVEQFQVLVVT